MKVYSLEYERWLRDPRISEAVDNCELSTLYQWLCDTMTNDNASSSGLLLDNEHQKAQKEEQD